MEKTATAPLPKELTLAYLALGAICIIWGSTYTGIKIGLEYFPPFLMAAIRQTGAGLLLLLWVFLSKKWIFLDKKYLLQQFVAGATMIAGGNGFITWGMQFVPSGLSAVIGSLTPLVVLLMGIAFSNGERFTWPIFLGIVLGFAGMGLIFHDGWAEMFNPDYRLGLVACFGSLLTWSFGTVLAKRFNRNDVPPMTNSGLQVLSGGLVLIILSLIFDKTHHIEHHWKGWAALTYLLVFGSAIAFTLYMYALKMLSASVSSLYTYINPVVAILLGWLFLGEKFSTLEGIGMAVAILGVFVANSAYLREKGRRK